MVQLLQPLEMEQNPMVMDQHLVEMAMDLQVLVHLQLQSKEMEVTVLRLVHLMDSPPTPKVVMGRNQINRHMEGSHSLVGLEQEWTLGLQPNREEVMVMAMDMATKLMPSKVMEKVRLPIHRLELLWLKDTLKEQNLLNLVWELDLHFRRGQELNLMEAPKALNLSSFGRVSPSYGARPNGYETYNKGGTKGPKPGYGAVAGTEANNAQGAKPNGYRPLIKGNDKLSKGANLGPQAPRVPAAPMFTKGVVPPAKPEPTREVPSVPEPTIGVPSLLTDVQPQVMIPQEKGQKPVAPQPASVMPVIQQPAPVLPQGKGPKPALPAVVLQGQVPVTPGYTPINPQGKASKPVQPAPVFPILPQGKAPKPIYQVPQSVVPQLAQVYPQGKRTKPFVPQQVVSQTTGQRPVAPATVPQLPRTKGPKPVAPEPIAPQTVGLPPAPEPTHALPQLEQLPKAANPELAGLGQPNSQGVKPAKPGFGDGSWFSNIGGAKTSNSGYANGQGILPLTGYGYGNGPAGVSEPIKGKPGSGYQPITGETAQLPYNGAPIIPAGLDGTSQIQPQTAELGPEAKSIGAYGVPYGGQPMGLGSEGKSQMKYGIGGLPFAGSPKGYGSDPYGKSGSPYASQAYGSKQANYGAPYNPKPLGLGSDSKSAGKYGFGGLPYGNQPFGLGSNAKYFGSVRGIEGLPYGGQPLGLNPDAGKSGKYGQPSLPYAPEAVSLGANAKPAGKYDQLALPFDSGMGGPVTDGQSVDQSMLPYQALPAGPEIYGVKSIDQFGEGEIPPQPDAALLQGFGAGYVKSTGTGAYIDGGLQQEAVPAPLSADPASHTAGSASFRIVTASQPEADRSSLAPPQAEASSPQLASVALPPVTPQQIHIQQQLKFHLHPPSKSWTGTEGKHDLRGFLGNGYQG
ncbi:calymmin [Hoplias malabaricus]|uniref:calymmin n=1 Tax=Hoplias malabaricus TaxID=27720 RepID=UPI0034632657